MPVNSPPGRWIIAGGSLATIETRDVNIVGGLNVDTNTFFVDKTNNRIGIGTNAPRQAISVGNMTISGDGHLLASSDVAGTVAISSGGSAVVYNYATAYAVAPYVQLTPTTDLGNLLLGSDFWVNSKTGSFVAFISPVGGAVTFNYLVIGSIQ